MKINIEEAAEILKEQDDILFLCHRDPDGDTIGSAMALCDCLSAMGKRVKMNCVSPLPMNISFMLREYPDFPEKFVVSVDTSVPKLLGDGPIRERKIDLCIDHHRSNSLYAEKTCLYYYGSAGELVFEILEKMGCEISPYAATCLLTAISSDTGSFKYSDVTENTFRIASKLMALGADNIKVRLNLYESKKKSRVMIEALALSSMEFYANDRITVVCITREMMEKCKATDEELEGIASFTRQVGGVDIGFTIKESETGEIKVSVRTSENADACKICSAFAGGGHLRAAGCRFNCSIEEAKEKLLQEAYKQIS